MTSFTELEKDFAALLPLDASARALALQQMPPSRRTQLLRLLDADQDPLDPLATSIAHGHTQANSLQGGQQLGAWQIGAEIGAGGMGTVYLAQRMDGQYTQTAAIKVLRGFPSADGHARLRRERQILAQLDHPNIARLLDGGETSDGQPYLVMEFIEGSSITQYAAENNLSRAARLALMDQIADAISHAHQRLVIHRDLKPANILVRSDGVPKLLDFGIAALIDSEAGRSDTQTRAWTPGYSSPEQAAGRAITTATDVFAFGMLLRELLTGVKPDGSPSTPALAAVQIDPDLAGILNKSTNENPGARYASIEAMRDDIGRWRAGKPVRAAPDSAWYRTRKFLVRNWRAVSIGMIVFLTVTGFVVRIDQERAKALVAQAQARAAALSSEQNLLRSQAVVDFFSDMFAALAPAQTMGQPVQPSALIARAEQHLRDAPPSDPVLAREYAAQLGSLYQVLGEGAKAATLLQQSISGESAADRYSALALAERHAALALIQSDMNDQNKRDQALENTLVAAQLRAQFAPDDKILALRSQLALVHSYVGTSDFSKAHAALASAEELLQPNTVVPPSLRIFALQTRADLAFGERDFAPMLNAAQDALAMLDQYPNEDQSLRIELERLCALAQQGLGRLELADAAFARAISEQKRLIGDTGLRATGLYNDRAVLLSQLGRFAQAQSMYDQSAAIAQAAGGPDRDHNPLLLNNSCDAQTGLGNYALALTNCQAAAAILIKDRPVDDAERMLVESNLARVLALTGNANLAVQRLLALQKRAAAAQGPDSFPVALHTFRAVRAALISGQLMQAQGFADDACKRLEATFSAPHVWRARARRVRAMVLSQRGQFEEARADLTRARSEAVQSLPANHPLIAQIDLDRARELQRSGDIEGARALLSNALPALRACCLASEIDRASAEKMALALRLPAQK